MEQLNNLWFMCFSNKETLGELMSVKKPCILNMWKERQKPVLNFKKYKPDFQAHPQRTPKAISNQNLFFRFQPLCWTAELLYKKWI